jgi:hypothetical protein
MSDLGSGATGNPTGNPAGEPTGNPAGSPAPQWYDALPEDTRGLIQNKGWKDPVDVINSYSNLEKLLGADKAGRGLVLPKDDADAGEWGKVYDRLGRPTSPDGYKLPVPEGDTGEFAKVAAGKFHELGLTAKQAEALAGWYNEQSAGIVQQSAAQLAQQSEADMASLEQEWGQSYDANIEASRRAVREFGFNEQELDAIERGLGTANMMKKFADIGKRLGESQFVEGKNNGNFGMSPEAARVRISQLKQDPEWTAKYLGGNADAKAELEKLMKVGYPS